MDDTQVSDVVFAILANDHELRFPEFLVVRDLVVVGLTFTDLEDTLRAIDGDLKILELFGIDGLEGHVKFVGGCLVGERFESAALQIDVNL